MAGSKEVEPGGQQDMIQDFKLQFAKRLGIELEPEQNDKGEQDD